MSGRRLDEAAYPGARAENEMGVAGLIPSGLRAEGAEHGAVPAVLSDLQIAEQAHRRHRVSQFPDRRNDREHLGHLTEDVPLGFVHIQTAGLETRPIVED